MGLSHPTGLHRPPDVNEIQDVVVVGGGLAGLAAATAAADAGASVVVVDRDGTGGRACTDLVGRFRFNRGAHALFKGGAGIEVLRRFGITPRGASPSTRRAMVRCGDEARPLVRSRLVGPAGVGQLARVAARVARADVDALSTRSAGEWLDELDLAEGPRSFIEMLLRTATYAADPYTVSADAAVGQLRLATHNVLYLDGGWAQLVQGLRVAASARGVTFVDGHAVAVRPEDRLVSVVTADREIDARRVVLAAGGPDASAALLPERPKEWRQLGPPSRVACLDLGFPADPGVSVCFGLTRPLYLSRHCPPADLAPDGGAVVQLMRYLAPDESPTAAELRAELVEHASIAGLDVSAAEEARYLHHMVACSALPSAASGGLRGRPTVRTSIPGVLVAGDWVGGRGLLADASLASGAAAGTAAAAAPARSRGSISA